MRNILLDQEEKRSSSKCHRAGHAPYFRRLSAPANSAPYFDHCLFVVQRMKKGNKRDKKVNTVDMRMLRELRKKLDS